MLAAESTMASDESDNNTEMNDDDFDSASYSAWQFRY